MTEFIVSFELTTLLYIIILFPVLTFLIIFAYRLARYSTDRYILKRLDDAMETSSSLIIENSRLLRSNLNEREKFNRVLADEVKND